MYNHLKLLLPAIAAYVLTVTATSRSPKCSSLAFPHLSSLSAYNASFLNATHYAEGALNVSGTVNQVSFCEVYASVNYGSHAKNNSLVFALWLPDKQYSSRLMAIGNGGEAGFITYSDMMDELNNGLGFAIAGGTAGHLASDNDAGTGPGLGAYGVYQPFLHDEDQVQAWLHNAISLFTPVAKALVKDFYGGHEVKYAYFRSCSTGGAQAFSLAEFHPGLFDGIIAGCPANRYTHLILAFLWNAQHTDTNATSLPQPVLDFIQAKVLQECDTIDGVADNLIENPLACTFNISSLACIAASNATCLTPSQLSAAKALYQGPVRRPESVSKISSIFPGLSLGSEGGWTRPSIEGLLSKFFTVPILQNLVYQNLSWDPATFNWGSDVDLVDSRASPLIDAINTNLTPFRNSGGKMIVYAGWADPNIAPKWSIQHVDAVTKGTLGQGKNIAENDFIKLVMVPGGGHCGGSVAYPSVPGQYGVSSALVDWVERAREPVEGIKSWGPANGGNRTRRLCTWPRVAKLKKGGDVDDWESYTCK